MTELLCKRFLSRGIVVASQIPFYCLDSIDITLIEIANVFCLFRDELSEQLELKRKEKKKLRKKLKKFEDEFFEKAGR